jgi:hypothetical protein
VISDSACPPENDCLVCQINAKPRLIATTIFNPSLSVITCLPPTISAPVNSSTFSNCAIHPYHPLNSSTNHQQLTFLYQSSTSYKSVIMTGRKYTHSIDARCRRCEKRVVDLVVATSASDSVHFDHPLTTSSQAAKAVKV